MIDPGTASTPERPGTPPSDAVILFDGRSLDGWVSTDGSPAKWKLENGFMEVAPGTGSIQTKAEFGDCQLHIEWAAPTVVKGESQGRGNSGVFLMGRYEIQVLDCYDNPTYPDGTTAAKALISSGRGRASTGKRWSARPTSPCCTTACSSTTIPS